MGMIKVMFSTVVGSFWAKQQGFNKEAGQTEYFLFWLGIAVACYLYCLNKVLKQSKELDVSGIEQVQQGDI